MVADVSNETEVDAGWDDFDDGDEDADGGVDVDEVDAGWDDVAAHPVGRRSGGQPAKRRASKEKRGARRREKSAENAAKAAARRRAQVTAREEAAKLRHSSRRQGVAQGTRPVEDTEDTDASEAPTASKRSSSGNKRKSQPRHSTKRPRKLNAKRERQAEQSKGIPTPMLLIGLGLAIIAGLVLLR